MRFLLLLILCFSTCGFVETGQANDSAASGIGGNWRLLSREHKSVQMVREHVVLRQLPDDSFETTADFEFANRGKAVTVTMGFPEMAGGDQAGNLGRLQGFRSWVGGQRVPVKFVTTGEGEDETGLYVKRVYFATGQTRRIRVKYHSQSGVWWSSGNFNLRYSFTGGNWQGKVKESVLDVILLPGRHYVDSLSTLRTSHRGATVSRKGNLFRFRWTNWQAQAEFAFPLHSELSGALYDGESRSYSYPPSRIIVPGRPRVERGAIQSFTAPDGFLCNGHLWIRARWLDEQMSWDAKRQRVMVRSTIGTTAFSARGATENSRKWPLKPTLPFYLKSSDERHLFLPVRQIEQTLPLKFTFDARKQSIRCDTDFAGFKARHASQKPENTKRK